VKAGKAALAAAIATAAIALVVVAPMAQSSRSRGGLKVVSVTSGFRDSQADAKCPRGFVVVGGGFFGSGPSVSSSLKVDERRWRVIADDPNNKRAATADAQAICAKGTGGFKVTDLGEADG
ncbi:MAG: hypothetical protein ACRDLL_16495, partial [Solirubrobacterales bacterium]